MIEQYLVVDKQFSRINSGGLDHISVLLWLPESDRTWYRPDEIQYVGSWSICNNKELADAIVTPSEILKNTDKLLVVRYATDQKQQSTLFEKLFHQGAQALLQRGYRLPNHNEAKSFGIEI